MTEFPNNASADPSVQHRRRGFFRRWSIRFLIVLAIGLVAVELVARFYLGLGDPPLMMADSKIEYLYLPNQTCHRFGNLIHYNAYSMRADDFPAHRTDPTELRVMVVGDSVVNGGSLTDQSQVVNMRLQKSLSEDLHRPVIVGNGSAGSWGPPNELAYMQRFGMFDADVFVLVVSSHDANDVPTFEPSVGVLLDMPDRKPWTATGELLHRYLLPRLFSSVRLGDLPPPPETAAKQSEFDECANDTREMIRMARAAGATPIVAQHLEKIELPGPIKNGHEILEKAAEDEHAQIVQFGPAFAADLAKGENPYRDGIHPNAEGHRVMAEVLLPVIEKAVAERKVATTQ